MMVINVYTHDPAKDKDVYAGHIEGDTFFRQVRNEHFMVKENGYGIQLDVLQKLMKSGVKNIEITTPRGTKHKAKFLDWATKGHRKNYGNGEQVFLSLDRMEIIK